MARLIGHSEYQALLHRTQHRAGYYDFAITYKPLLNSVGPDNESPKGKSRKEKRESVTEKVEAAKAKNVPKKKAN